MSATDIFGTKSIYTEYRATIRFTHLVVGGVPSDASVIEKWLRARMDLEDAAIISLVEETTEQRGIMTAEEQVDAVMGSDLAPSINGFKRNTDGELCIEARNIKAAFKEWANSAYPGVKWPNKPEGLRKGLKAYLAEALMIPGTLYSLGVTEPTLVEERIKHVSTPMGPRSTITRCEVVERPTLTFPVWSRDDFLTPAAWPRIWQVGEQIGLGADRGRSDGKFELVEWVKA